MQKATVCDFIAMGYFDKACIEADLEYEKIGDVFPLRNKMYALMHLRQYHKVIEVADQCITLRNGETDSDFIKAGMAYYFLNKNDIAINILKRGEGCKYTDAAGGIELRLFEYFIAVKTFDDKLKRHAIKGIKKLLKNKQALIWPAPLGSYLLDMISEVEVSNSISTIPILRERNLCQVNFISAIKKLEVNDLNGYKDKLIETVKDGPSVYIEEMFYVAQEELK